MSGSGLGTPPALELHHKTRTLSVLWKVQTIMCEAQVESPETDSTRLFDVRDTVERSQQTVEFSAHKNFSSQSFIQFVSEVPAEQIISYFRAVLWELETKRKLEEYHLKVFSKLRRCVNL